MPIKPREAFKDPILNMEKDNQLVRASALRIKKALARGKKQGRYGWWMLAPHKLQELAQKALEDGDLESIMVYAAMMLHLQVSEEYKEHVVLNTEGGLH